MSPNIEDLNHSDVRVRIMTAQQFIEAGDVAIPALTAALEHPSAEVRWRAAAAAGYTQNAAVIPALLKLNQTDLYETQFNCTWALGNLGDPRALPMLLELLNGAETPSPDIRYNAALALARLGQMGALREAAQNPTHLAYRVARTALVAANYF